ncbi:hypothetical protein EUGRSUZ_B01852 [Eucalyptus grandis]|uniref:Uncharacterized protein n=2 Tax=Eucalyptus grandis TaxID=71139 RepID=A0ACC3LQY1_EUCGR|nr:hypothetical protein EUGRSUZ_B01852 [Eucalyptus grandis]
MEKRLLEVTVMSAKDLKDINHLHRMDPYVSVSLTAGGEQYTHVHENGGTSPRWEDLVTFIVDEATARAGLLSLNFKIMTKKTIGDDKEVGTVELPVKELLEQQDDGMPKVMRCSVRQPSGEAQGFLEFFYRFGELFYATAYPPSAGAPQGYGYREPPRRGSGLMDVLAQGLMIGSIISDWVDNCGM